MCMLLSEVIGMDETYMALFMQTGNPVFYTAAKTGSRTDEQTPPKPEG